jgi:NDP-sugar pyrophosphorylase family protein
MGAFARSPEVDLLLSYTSFIDDENPLYIEVDPGDRVVALGEAAAGSPHVTAGLYGVSPTVMPRLRQAVAMGKKKLRSFLGFVIEGGATVRGYRLSKAVDVDRPADLEVAEAFLREHEVPPWS